MLGFYVWSKRMEKENQLDIRVYTRSRQWQNYVKKWRQTKMNVLKKWLSPSNLVPVSIHHQSRNNSISIKNLSYTYTEKSVNVCALMCWWCCRSQESSWMTSLALCALCWTLLSSGVCPDSSIRDKAFCTVVCLAPPRSPSRYCSSTKNLSSGIWGLWMSQIVMICFMLKLKK